MSQQGKTASEADNGEGKSLNLAMCIALVVGNMVGSGFFIAPSALAPYGSVAIIGWGIMAVGAVCLGMVFARLSRIAPVTGGPYAYTRMGFGRFPGFLIAWGYWISIWASLPAMAAALVGYLGVLVPALDDVHGLKLVIALGSIWGVAALNMRGVQAAGLFQAVTVYTKLVPFIGISVFGLFWVDWSTFETLNPSNQPFLSALAATAPLTMFAFLGVESATVPAGSVKNPTRTIPLATIIGTLIAASLYILGTVVVMGVIPRESLMLSAAPFADAAKVMWGDWAAIIISLAAIISSLGALNGWTLMLAQVPMAAAQDGAMPSIFCRMSRRGVPACGIVISVSLATLLTLMDAAGGKAMAAFYNLIVDLSTDAAMIPYVFCAVVEGVLYVSKQRVTESLNIKTYIPVGTVAFIFSISTIYGAGPEAGMYSLLLLLLAVPIWMFLVAERRPGQADE
jgi:amino acid transporter